MNPSTLPSATHMTDRSIGAQLSKCHIRKVVLHNFRKFENRLEICFERDLNVLIGDNEAGKSTILLAMDLALSASRSKAETIGLEPLISKSAVDKFLAGARRLADLPVLFVEIYLSEVLDFEARGYGNSCSENACGVRFTYEPSEDWSKEIEEVLIESKDNFPYEFYTPKFATFAKQPYGGRRKYLDHIVIDGAQINTEYAHREYTKKLYQAHATTSERASHENKYRQAKRKFWSDHLNDLNSRLDLNFWVRTSSRSNLEGDLVIVKDGMPIEYKGRGQQSLTKTEFALERGRGKQGIDALFLEEPENHLSHVNMHALLERIAKASGKQVIVTTHSSLICSRLDLRKAILLDDSGQYVTLNQLDQATADFFCKAPNHNVLEFAMSRRVILVEGDAEYILASELYQKCTGSSLETDRVHVISVGGTSFKRYLALAKALNVKVAVVRDNDGDYERTCVLNYEDYIGGSIQVFADKDSKRSTFEICLYQDNSTLCDTLFGKKLKTRTVQQYMLDNKADCALELLKAKANSFNVPGYLREAMLWIRS